MSSLLAPQWSRSSAPRPARSARPSLREVCLIGSARTAEPTRLPSPSVEEPVPHLGRFYRVAEAQNPQPRDARHYLHLVPITTEPPQP